MELITDNFFEWVVVALAILNFIVTLKSKEKITLLLTGFEAQPYEIVR